MSDDLISREAVDEYITNLLSGYLYAEERTRFEELSAFIWELPSVTPRAEQKDVLDKIRAEIENHCGLIKEDHCKYCGYCNSVMGVREILEIIDKYKVESEEEA